MKTTIYILTLVIFGIMSFAKAQNLNNIVTVAQIGYSNDLQVEQNGGRNELILKQLGTNFSNKATIWQEGNDNYINAEQTGYFSDFNVLQVGNNIRLETFKQTNVNGNKDAIFQRGNNLTLIVSFESSTAVFGNIYTQTGTNLSATLNTTIPLSGITVTQTGQDMKVVIDQSFFSFPLK